MVKATTSRPTTETPSGLPCRGILRPTTVSPPGCRNPLDPLMFSWVREIARDSGWAEPAKAPKCVTSSFKKKKIGARKWARKQCRSLGECFLKRVQQAPLLAGVVWVRRSPGRRLDAALVHTLQILQPGHLKLCLQAPRRSGRAVVPARPAWNWAPLKDFQLLTIWWKGSFARSLKFVSLFNIFRKAQTHVFIFTFFGFPPKLVYLSFIGRFPTYWWLEEENLVVDTV